jgi:outer membrane protein TolC
MALDYVIDYVKKQIESMRKDVEELEELIRLGELMGIDVSQHRLRLEQLKTKVRQYEDGLNKYLSARATKSGK